MVSAALILPITPKQAENLVLLLKRGALLEPHAKSIYQLQGSVNGPMPNPLVLGKLCDMGFAAKRVMPAHGRGQRCMHYWLTRAGIQRAQAERQTAINARSRSRRRT
jgi:hypothetical protein